MTSAGSVPDGSLPGGSLPGGSLPEGSLSDGSLPGVSLPNGSLRHDHAGRRDRLREQLGGLPLLVSSPVNIRYLSGFTGSAGHVFIGAEASADRVITDERYTARVAEEAPDLRAALTRDPLDVALRQVSAGEQDGPRLGLEADHLTWASARGARKRAEEAGIELVGTTAAVARLRLVKDDAEVARIERACELTVAALAWLLDEVVAPGKTERELALALERRFIDLGADDVAFPSIVAGGPNGAVPHHAPGDRPLATGDLLTIDCGAMVDGYHADYTRTVGIGHLDVQQIEIFEVVLSAQAAGRAAALAGASCGAVDAAARTPITEAGWAERFVHGTGHGVGLEIHEAPAVAQDAAATLSVGTTLTVEPGVYLPGTGGVRIEDTLVIVPDGPARALTNAPRELRII